MKNLPSHNTPELLGSTPIARLPDRLVWSLMITPQVKSLLGRVTKIRGPERVETVEGFFPGDEVTNLNDHKLYGGQSGYLRFPYVSTVYYTEFGAVVIKRDAVKAKVFGWFGNVNRGNAELIYKCSLRDRRFDGTLRANDSSLLDFPYDDIGFNAPLPPGNGLELSIYGFVPGSKIITVLGDAEYQDFVDNPFTFIDRPEVFLEYFDRAWKGQRAPGQTGGVIPDVSKLIVANLEKIARQYRYDYMENAPSHYHVVMWAIASGYSITYERHQVAFDAVRNKIAELKASGLQLNRVQEGWLVVLQSLPREFIPDHLYLDGVKWPQNNIDQQNLWMHKALNERAAKMLKAPLKD